MKGRFDRHARPPRVSLIPVMLVLAGWLTVLATPVPAMTTEPTTTPPLMLSADSNRDFEATIDAVTSTMAAHQLRALRERRTTHGDVRIHEIYYCAFDMLPKAMQRSAKLGYTLPCRVSVRHDDSGVRILATNPQAMAKLLELDPVEDMCADLTVRLENLLWEASL